MLSHGAVDHASRRMMDFRGRKHAVTITSVILLAIAAAAGVDELAKGGGENNGCSAVKIAWGLQGLGSHMVPSSPLPGL